MSWSVQRRRTRRPITIAAVAALCAFAIVPVAQAAPPPTPTTTAAFTGGIGTATVGGTLFARDGAPLTLTVTAPGDTVCVDVSGALAGHQTSPTAKATWTFTFTAGAGDGVQAVTAAATDTMNNKGVCTGRSTNADASFTLDNTGPVVTAALSPTPNAAGWNNSDVDVTWSATDAGSGVASGPTPASDSQNASTAATGTTKTATATDKVGNVGSGSTTVKLDKDAPTITATRSPEANADGWNNDDVTVGLTCADALSGVKSCTGGGTVVLSAEGANQSVTGTAVDNSDNTASTTVDGINIDKTAPTLTGAPTTEPTNGWYRGDVTIGWTASDALSGIAGAAPTSSTISGEGAGLTANASVTDKAGNTRQTTSPAVGIDRTAPVTSLTGASNAWTNDAVTLELSATDGLSGVASTTYAVDGGAVQSGNELTLTTEGDHTVTFSSTDVAGNVEGPKTAHVKIDKTAPSISHSFAPEGYTNGSWTNANSVTVTFACTDTGGSGVASCTGPVTTSDEGEHTVDGTATDGAGNEATDTAAVRIDRTVPTVSTSTTAEANSADWYRTLVRVAFACADGASGVAECPASVTLGEGAEQSATGTAYDVAGNSASGSFGPVNIDLTAPELHADLTSGWHTGDVTVDWSCTDALSGPAGQPDDDIVGGEGADLSSSAECTDVAGNTASKTIKDIKIDRHAPATIASVPDPLASGWYGGPVTVTLTGTDALSGVAHTYYTVDGGARQQYDEPFAFTTKGIHTITYWSVDNAGNTEDATPNSLTLKIDDVAPATTVINPISPASGWYVVSGIPVAFDAVDAESGIHATYYRIDDGDALIYGEAFTKTLTDGDHTIEYWSVDNAGNVEEHHTVTVGVDTTAPSISAAVISGTLGDNGWYTGPATVHFTCSDDGSGLATGACPADKSVSTDGAAQVVTGSVTDRAGNEAGTSMTINLDQTGPTITGVNVDGKRYTLGETVPAPTCTATDEVSGPASCVVIVTGGNANGVGTFAWTATAKDGAGNTSTSRGTYKVVYRFDGFLQPINDTAHQIGLNTSVFKAGSTVPTKLQVKRSDGTVVQPVTAPVWLTPVKGAATSAPVDESLYSATADSGSVYKYDATAQQWSYNWKSLTAGYYWRIGVRLDDGETYYVTIGLR